MSINRICKIGAGYLVIGLSTFGIAANAGGYNAPINEAPVAVVAKEDMNWNSFYTGLSYSTGTYKDIYREWDGDWLFKDDTEHDFDGYGLFAGYTRDFGQIVIGGEFDYNKMSIDLPDAPDAPGEVDLDLMRLRGRVGYDLGRFQPYVTAGVARIFGDYDFSATGFAYGLGLDYLVSDNFLIGLEYSMHSFEDVYAEGDEDAGWFADADVELFQLRAAYRF